MNRLRGLAAAIGLLVIVVGVPVLLYGLGGGLPSGLPSLHQASGFLGRPISDTDVLRGVSLFCWAVWLLFLLAVATEANAWARSRPGPAITHRGFRIPGLQGAAGSLFLTAVLLLPQRPTAAPLAGPSPSPAAVIAVVGDVRSAAAVSQVPDARIPYSVRRGETLWGIAEAHVGNGLAWRQITDVDGRTLDTGLDEWVQVNGRMIFEREARLIFGGETVFLPASWAPATQVAIDVPIKVPPAARVGPASGDPVESPAVPAPPSVPPPSITNGQVPTAHFQEQNPATAVAELIGAGIVGGAVVATLDRLRDRQTRVRRPGRRIPLPVNESAVAEMALRSTQRPDLIGLTHVALHGLAADLQRGGGAVPTICAVLAGEDRIEVLLDQRSFVPDPWQPSDDGFRWSLPTSQVPTSLGSGLEPLPALLPVGRLLGSTTEVMINLAAAGILHVTGDPQRSSQLVHAVTLALGGLPWMSSAEVVLVGFGELLGDAADHIRTVPSLDDVIDELEKQAAELQDAFGQPVNSGIDRCEGWLPTIVLLGRSEDADSTRRLESLARSGAGILAMTVSPPSGAGWDLDISSSPAALRPLHLAIEPLSAPDGWVPALEEMVALAIDPEDVSVDEPPYDQLESAQRPPACPVTVDSQPNPPSARINLLGPVTFDGVDNFTRPRSFEIVLYLAMHPSGISESTLDETIWPTKKEVPRSTRDQAVSAARIALGGKERFPLAQGQESDKIYRLTDQVGTDWIEFCALHRLGRANNEVGPLHSALELVRGRPFGDLDAGPGFQWLHTEGHLRHMQCEIAEAAELAAGLYLAQGQPLDARWAAYQGLLAGPHAERLWVHLMAAADALGEAQEVERVMAEMDIRMGLEGDFSSLHPDTIAAYRQYSRQRATHYPGEASSG